MMHGAVRLIGIAMLLGTGSVAAQQPTAPQARITIWDSVYTAEQAARGERTAYVNCFSCHTAPDWTSSRFMDASAEPRLGDLFQMISRQMPMDSPGKLSLPQYADIIAYMLRLQGAPAGGKELPSDVRELDKIFVTRPPPG